MGAEDRADPHGWKLREVEGAVDEEHDEDHLGDVALGLGILGSI